MKQHENIKSFLPITSIGYKVVELGRIYKSKYSMAFFSPKIRALGRHQIKKKKEYYRVNVKILKILFTHVKLY
jgi:hypothetical protein